MQIIANSNIEQKLFMLAIIFLPITHFSVSLPLVDRTISLIFVFLGMSISLYKVYKKNIVPDRFEKAAFCFLAVSLLWQVLCTVIGILEYSYYDIIYLEQMEKLRYLLQNLAQTGIRLEELTAIKIWLGLRFVKDCVLNVLFTYGTSLWIYHLYKDYSTDTEKSSALVSHVTAAVSVLCLILITYSVFVTGYLRGSKFCADIISSINPLLYEINSFHGGWPPLLLPGRLRSLCAEPSFFGIISVIIIFILFYKNLTTYHVFYGCLLSAFVMMTVMTRSRTAIPLFAGQGLLLLVYVLGMNRTYIKALLKIIVVVSLSLFAGLYLMAGFKPVETAAAQPAGQRVQASTNVASPDIKAAKEDLLKRSVPFADKASFGSDMSRLNSTKAYFLTGLQNPVFGVGKGLSNAYAEANYWKEDLWRDNLWSTFIRQKGVLRSPIPVLNHWSYETAQFGIVGLLIFLLPAFYLFRRFLRVFPNGVNMELACALIAYIGSNVAMFSNWAFLTYYIMTGILLVLLPYKTERQE